MARTAPPADRAAAAESLVRTLHAAGVYAEQWPSALDGLRELLDARVVTVSHHQFTTGIDTLLFESPAGDGFSRDGAAFAVRNPWFLSSAAYTPGRVMTGDELISAADLKRTDFYRGFLQPRGLLHRLCGVIAQRGSGSHVIAAYRAEQQAPFGAAERATLQRLLEHITLSLHSQWRWQEADDLARALAAQSNQDANPLLLVTALAEPVYRNPAAEHLLAQRVGLRLDGGRLVADNPADQRLFGQAVARMANHDPAGGSAAAPCVVALTCADPTQPVVAVVRAAGQVYAPDAAGRRGLAMVAVRGSHAAHDPATCLFARRFELTQAQAKVSALVFAGQPLASIAGALHVSENTVRSHLKQIFQKTDTHGQMDLVHLHARVCATLP